MRCFIFGTGRCGTVAIANAFRRATNYTVCHESNSSLLAYPDDHIEVNPQLRVRMREIVKLYPSALYVWLQRDIKLVTRSYATLDGGRWMNAWWSFHNTIRPVDQDEAAAIAVHEIAALCDRAFHLCPRPNRLAINIAEIKPAFTQLWARLKCQGALSDALASFDKPVNTTAQRERKTT